jgi:hypothetical protein
MPQFQANKSATLSPGSSVVLWSNETINPSGSPPDSNISQAFFIRKEGFYPAAISLALKFAADPGVFHIDFQTADSCDDADFFTIGSLTTVNANFATRLELTNVVAKFGRLVLVSLTNAVALSAQVS